MPVTAKKETKTTKKTASTKSTAKKTVKKPTAKKDSVKKSTEKKEVKKTSVKKVEKAPAKKAKSAATVEILSQVKAEVKKQSKPKKTEVKKAPKTKKAANTDSSVSVAAPTPVVAIIPEKPDFVAGDFVVYPAHGVGQVEGIDIQHVAGMEIALYTIVFEKDRMRLKLPVTKAKNSGLRKLSSKDRLKDALATLQGRSQTRRIMWSRRAQEYETKINSGDPVAIAEVLRDLKKEDAQSEQSYSERQIYQAALERLAREVAAIEEIAEDKAVEKLEVVLSKIA